MITDYASLQSALTDYATRDDLSTVVTTFIAQGEARIYRDLRVIDMEVTASETITNGSFALPADYLKMRNLYVTDATGAYLYELRRQSPAWLRGTYQIQSAQGTPQFYAREGQNIIVGPYPDASYPVSMLYYSRLASLSNTNTTNWLITKNPDLIFAAAMVELAIYTQDQAALQYWESKYGQVMSAVQGADKRERMSGGAPSMSPA